MSEELWKFNSKLTVLYEKSKILQIVVRYCMFLPYSLRNAKQIIAAHQKRIDLLALIMQSFRCNLPSRASNRPKDNPLDGVIIVIQIFPHIGPTGTYKISIENDDGRHPFVSWHGQ